MSLAINRDGVQKTLLVPLWSRAKFSRQGRSILVDSKAIELVESLQFDFGPINRNLPEMIQLMNVVRARMFDDSIRSYLTARPKATIVNLGAGLDTTFSRVDNGTLRWYDIDLPDVVELRRRLIPETDRSHCIAGSIFEMKLPDSIGNGADGLLFFSGGVLEYFDPARVGRFLSDLAGAFPGSELVFNTTVKSRIAAFFTNRSMKRMGMKADPVKWGIKLIDRLRRHDSRIELVERYPMFSRIDMETAWSGKTRRRMRWLDRTKAMNMVHLRFSDRA